MKKTIIALALLPTLFSVRLNAGQPLPHQSILYITNDKPKVSVSSEDPAPIYNLYQLAKLLAKKKDNYHALGYLNQWTKGNTGNHTIVEGIKSKFIDYSDINKSIYGQLDALLQETIDGVNVYIYIKDKKDAKKEVINKVYVDRVIPEKDSKEFVEFINDHLEEYKEIDTLNKNLKSLRDIKIVDSVNLFIKHNENFFPKDYELKDFSNSNIQEFNSNLKGAKKLISKIETWKERLDSLKINSDKNIKGVNGLIEDINTSIINGSKLEKLKEVESEGFSAKLSYIDSLISKYKEIDYSSLVSVVDRLEKLGGKDGKQLKESMTKDNNYDFLKYKIFYDQAVAKRDDLASSFVKMYIKNLNPEQKKNVEVIRKEDVTAAQQLVVVQAALQAEQQVASGFKIPSESDVIMALAQFMANRAKQETMIWFVQNLQKELQHSLLWDVFPETKKLVEEFDGQSLPDFNETWRLGLSSDFVKLPTNLINGHWLAAKSVESGKAKELDKLKQTVQISNHFYKLIREKQNYRSIIESFYNLMQERSFLQDSKLKAPIALLHVATQELFNYNDGKISFLTTEQIKDLSSEELSILGDLIELKYGRNVLSDITKILPINKFDFSKDGTSALSKLANFVSDLSQLEVLSKSASSDTSGSFPIVWDKMISMLKYADINYNSFEGKFDASGFSEIAQIEDLHKIYQHIARKEFKPAAKAALDLVKPLVSLNNFVIVRSTDKISFKRLKRAGDPLTSATPLFDISTKKMSFLNGENVCFDSLRIIDQNKLEIKGGSTLSFSIQDLVKEFKTLRFSDSDIKLDLSKKYVDENLKNVKLLMKGMFNVELGSNLKDETPLRFANMIVDLYDDPTKILNKATYEDFKLDNYISHSYVGNKSLNKLVQVSGMFADILTSRDERGIYRAIESVVAPPESYMIKRKNDHTLSINGYVGGFVGYQSVLSKPSDFKSSFIYGITAPIGFTYSQKKWGVFAQFIDLGNAVNHFLWNTSDKIDKQKLTVKELFSPGISVLYNIPKSPFVLFAGAKMVQLDKRYDANFGMINAKGLDMLQFTTGLKIDIPFFTLGRWNRVK